MDDNPKAIPIKAAAFERRSAQYFTAVHTAAATYTIAPGESMIVGYAPLTVAGAGAQLTPLPICSAKAPSTTAISAFPSLVADASAQATPIALNSVLPDQVATTATGTEHVLAVLKGYLTVEVTNAVSIDAMPAMQAIGLANLDVETTLQPKSVSVAASNWYDATKDNLVIPFLRSAPLTTTIENHATSYVPRQPARAGIVSLQPPVESGKGSSFYRGNYKADADVLPVSDVLGYSPTGGAPIPHIAIHNRGSAAVIVQVGAKTVYAVPFDYTAAKTLSAYCQDEASGVCLDDDVACALSLGGVGTSLLDSALAAKEAFICALSRCRSSKPDHMRVAVAAANHAAQAMVRSSETFLSNRVSDPGSTHGPRYTPTEMSVEDAQAGLMERVIRAALSVYDAAPNGTGRIMYDAARSALSLFR